MSQNTESYVFNLLFCQSHSINQNDGQVLIWAMSNIKVLLVVFTFIFYMCSLHRLPCKHPLSVIFMSIFCHLSVKLPWPVLVNSTLLYCTKQTISNISKHDKKAISVDHTARYWNNIYLCFSLASCPESHFCIPLHKLMILHGSN